MVSIMNSVHRSNAPMRSNRVNRLNVTYSGADNVEVLLARDNVPSGCEGSSLSFVVSAIPGATTEHVSVPTRPAGSSSLATITLSAAGFISCCRRCNRS